MRKYRLRPYYFGAIGVAAVLMLGARHVVADDFTAAILMLLALVLALTGWVLSIVTARCPRCKSMLPLKGATTMENCPFCKNYLKKRPKNRKGTHTGGKES